MSASLSCKKRMMGSSAFLGFSFFLSLAPKCLIFHDATENALAIQSLPFVDGTKWMKRTSYMRRPEAGLSSDTMAVHWHSPRGVSRDRGRPVFERSNNPQQGRPLIGFLFPGNIRGLGETLGSPGSQLWPCNTARWSRNIRLFPRACMASTGHRDCSIRHGQ